ncbi:Sodium/hydrogen exchanger 2 [Zea mays]|uniref:Sodium/hydrogen exchanger 2 n=1 Tax=Zea mays TaxID=4577 RepID=A0A1D6MYU3_MAIZE|nr:Sodium/hydrogen exchanger 2 [Zea mays]
MRGRHLLFASSLNYRRTGSVGSEKGEDARRRVNMQLADHDSADRPCNWCYFLGNRFCLHLTGVNQDETPLLYSLVFGEGVVNDATSVVLFNAIENLDINNFDAIVLLNFIGKFLYLCFTSTIHGVATGLLSAYIIKKLCFARSAHNSLSLWG